MNKIEVHSFEDLYNKHRFDERPCDVSSLWHYTSADGFLGIIRNEPKEHGKLHFWFTRSDCLNDPSEGNHVLVLFKNICDNLLQEEKINNSFYNCIKNIEIPLHQFINFPVPPHEGSSGSSVCSAEDCDSFICSFSLKEDSLDMWRYYSKGNGGYGLKLNTLLFDEYKKYEHSFHYQKDAIFSKIRGYKVIYDNEAQENLLKEIVLDTFSVYESNLETDECIKINTQGFIKYALNFFQFQFKHEGISKNPIYKRQKM